MTILFFIYQPILGLKKTQNLKLKHQIKLNFNKSKISNGLKINFL